MAFSTCLSGDNGDLGYGSLGVGVQELGTVPDNAAILLGSARQESGNVNEGDDGDVESVAKTDKSCSLDRGIDIKAA